MHISLLSRLLFISSLTHPLGAQTFNQVAPPFNSMTLPGQPTSPTSEQDQVNGDWPKTDSLSENIQLTLQSRYEALNHSPVLKVETIDGQTYTGSIKGINLWDGSCNISITTENANIPENHITALTLDSDNNLWIGTHNQGMAKGIGYPVKPFKTKIIQAHDLNIYSIVSEGNGAIWVTYSDGGFEYFQNGISKAYFPSTKTE